MADENQEQELPQKGGMLKKMLMAGGALALLAIGIVVGPMIMGDKADQESAADGGAAAEGAGGGQELYTSLHPPLVVNFSDSQGEPHFMQVTMEVMARDQDVINAVREHTPVIRNNLILLYGSASYENVITREGKEALLADGLRTVQEVMNEQIGEPGVEALYFTSLIIQ